MLIPDALSAAGSSGSYNSETRFSFVGYNATDAGSGYQARGSDQITGSFSIGAAYAGRLGILKSCGNSLVESGEECDNNNLNGETCLARGYGGGSLRCSSACLFDTSGCTAQETVTGGAASGTAGASGHLETDTVAAKSVYALQIAGGELKAFTPDKSGRFSLKNREYLLDIKEVTETSVRIWLLHINATNDVETKTEIDLSSGAYRSLDLDSDGKNDLLIEVKGITPHQEAGKKSYSALLYIKQILRQEGEAGAAETQEIVTVEGIQGQLVREIEKPDKKEKNLKDYLDKISAAASQAAKKIIPSVANFLKMKAGWVMGGVAVAALLALFLMRLRYYRQTPEASP